MRRKNPQRSTGFNVQKQNNTGSLRDWGVWIIFLRPDWCLKNLEVEQFQAAKYAKYREIHINPLLISAQSQISSLEWHSLAQDVPPGCCAGELVADFWKIHPRPKGAGAKSRTSDLKPKGRSQFHTSSFHLVDVG